MFSTVKPMKPVAPVTEIPNGNYALPVKDLLLQDIGYGRRAMLFEFHFTKSGACNLYLNGDKVASAGGHGYDKTGVTFARWFTKTFAKELKAIFDQPKYQKQLDGSSMGELADGSGRHPWYCTHRDGKTGEISINGMSGRDNVVGIMERTVGLTLRYVGEGHDSSLYMLAVHKTPKQVKK